MLPRHCRWWKCLSGRQVGCVVNSMVRAGSSLPRWETCGASGVRWPQCLFFFHRVLSDLLLHLPHSLCALPSWRVGFWCFDLAWCGAFLWPAWRRVEEAEREETTECAKVIFLCVAVCHGLMGGPWSPRERGSERSQRTRPRRREQVCWRRAGDFCQVPVRRLQQEG